jgi:magnesium transporter
MVDIFVYRNGSVSTAERVDPAWLDPESGVVVWVDLTEPTDSELAPLTEIFHFHPLSIEDAKAEINQPKIETYDGYLYVVLHGIDSTARVLATHDVDFFVGTNYVVSVHDAMSRSFPEVAEICRRNPRVLGDGPAAMVHRLVDTMVDHYRPEVERIADRIEELEDSILEELEHNNVQRDILSLKRDVTSLRRVVLPQRDVLGRLARREFPQLTDEVSYRFRDVYDHVVRVSDEALLFQDRINAMFETHLANVSNRLNQIMKVLTILSTIFLPLSVLTSLYGMNVDLPHLPGGAGMQFWWVLGMMVTMSGTMLWFFRRRRWI